MNANELAKLLEVDSWYKLVTREEIATMLRQQADLIRNLQKSLGFKNSGYETINLTPSKELTDEEINKIYLEKYDGHMCFLSPDEVREFARAILRKAQEK